MKKIYLLVAFLFMPALSQAVTLPWSTTFNCAEWAQPASGSCDGLQLNYGSWYAGGQGSQITGEANNPLGGGRGARFRVGDGNNVNSSPMQLTFPSPQKELWIRWYMRYEQGFKWSHLSYDKHLYIGTGASGIDAIPEFYGADYSLAAQGTSNQHQTKSSHGWNQVMGGSAVSDGKFHCYEVHLKMDSSGSNGIGRLWIDGVLQSENTAVNWSNGNATARNGWTRFHFYSNQSSPGNGRIMYVDYDDMVVYNSPPPNVDSRGNRFIGPIAAGGSSTAPAPAPSAPTSPSAPAPTTSGTVLFEEKFEDGSFSGRGWYDNTSPALSSTERIPGSTSSVAYRFPTGATKPVSGGAMRKKFAETDAVYIRYYVKYSTNWQGSNRSYHPHEFYLLTNKDGDWSGLANTRMTAYIEQNQGVPVIGIQDSLNIDQSRIGQNLTNITEMRGVAGCNGDSDGYGNGTCYSSGSYVNGKMWRAAKTYFSNSAGPYFKSDWHKVEAYLKLNSIVNGKGVADGVIRYWFDGEPVMDYRNVMFRTAQNADMKFNKLVIAPWIGDGSPVDQTFWVDDLVVATAPLVASEPAPAPSEPLPSEPVPSVPAPTTNTAPLAHAGSDQTVSTGSHVVLDGSRSSDADGDPVAFSWTFVSKPVGSAAVLSGANGASPTFRADVAGEYVVSLVVHDGKASSMADTVSIKAVSKIAGPKNLRKIKN